MRLAWFTPLSPARSGLAVHTADVLSRLGPGFEVDVFVDRADPATLAPRARPAGVHAAHDFPWRHARRPYDLPVYDLADAAGHDYAWGYVVRYPGLAVLHDAVLHHARGTQLLRRVRVDDYRAELRFDRPDRAPDVCEIARAGIPEILAAWPLLRPILATARRSAVLDAEAAADVQRRYPDARIESLRYGTTAPRAAGPGRTGGGPVVFGVCAPTAAVRRLDLILDAFAALPPTTPARLHFLGPVADHGDARARLDALELAERVTLAPPGDDPDAALAATDVCLCLAWPPAGETTPLWLRCLAAGKPTIVRADARLADVPLVDPCTWRPLHGAAEDGAAVGVDVLEEASTLALALRGLAGDAERRAALGRGARRYAETRHPETAMMEDYRRVIRTAALAPARHPDGLPAHLRADGLEHARAIAASMGTAVDILDEAAGA